MNSKELKKDKLYLCEIEYDITTDTGTPLHVSELLVGYMRASSEEDFFFGCSFSHYKGSMTGGDMMNLTLKEFSEQVKSVREIA